MIRVLRGESSGADGAFPRTGGRLLWLAFALPAFGSAFLVFWIEPLYSKVLLPVLGGAPAVWNTALMFYQSALLVGYLYAHLGVRWLGPRRQAVLHLGLIALVVATLPVAAPGATGGEVERPVVWMLGTLTVSLALPFVLLAATAPLLQRWLAAVEGAGDVEPYTLYAISNLGSFGALVAFPLLLEPRIPASEQLLAWSWTTGLVALGLAGCAVVVWRFGSADGGEDTAAEAVRSAAGTPATDVRADPPDRRAAPGRGTRLTWLVLAFVPSSLLLGVTTHLSTDVAAVPLLWVAPLALYLLTFVVAFGWPDGDARPGGSVTTVHAVLLTAFVLLGFWGLEWDLSWGIPFHLGVFTCTALVLHRRLVASRPPPARLTEFYLWLAAGGALGGAFNALAAPVLFDSVVEYELLLLAACFLRPSVSPRVRGSLEGAGRALLAVAPGVLVAVALASGIVPGPDLGSPLFWGVTAAAAAGCLFLRRRAWQFGLAVTSVALAAALVAGPSEAVLYTERSFFGSHRVTAEADPPRHVLHHGTTVHGAQLRTPGRRLVPTTYYHPGGPAGQVFDALAPALEGERIAVVGLGTGSMLCHGGRHQRWTFFEIDPEVVRVARDRELFTFLDACPPSVEVETGDARLSLVGEPADRYALIAIDAFSSDAIPVHLLTREALAVYRRALAPGGVLLFHVSNRYLDLGPVLARLATELDLAARIAEHRATASEERRELASDSEWVVLADRARDLGPLAAHPAWRPLRGDGGPLWTDDHAAVVELFR